MAAGKGTPGKSYRLYLLVEVLIFHWMQDDSDIICMFSLSVS